MNTSFGSIAVVTLVASAAFAQSWDPVKQATGWARVDKDGSIAFYDPASRRIYSWMREGGILGSVDVSKLAQAPEKWVVDFDFNAWVVSGRELTYVEKSGKSYTVKLPYEVGDLTWDVNGFYLSYKTPEPFVEMRNFDSGSVVWYVRNRAMKDEASPAALHRIAINESRTLFITSRNSLQLEAVDCNNGRLKGATSFTFSGGLAPGLTLGAQGRGAVEWWLNKNMAVSAVPASQMPTLQQSGLLLAIENLTAGTLELLSTGLSEQHTFIGLLESEAVFIAPGGGLVFLPLQG
ncbi:MAG TPA: hypothetical protein PKM35_02220 [Holophaga sp.]|nr:hypothetical protein [Holophaga sp.]HPS68611.1 hypothetical protein [Holophaga sp.]